jgi:release factor glutamine methyltransferase
VTAVPPYVPTPALELLPRDTLAFEDATLYDGGVDGLTIVRRIIRDAPQFLRPQGSILLEIGGTQDEVLVPELERLGYVDVTTWHDEDGDLRGIEARSPGS